MHPLMHGWHLGTKRIHFAVQSGTGSGEGVGQGSFVLGRCISSLTVMEVRVSLVFDGHILPFVFSKNVELPQNLLSLR